MFPYEDKQFRIEVRRAERTMEGHSGYRRGQHLLLRSDVFNNYIQALKEDDFETIKNIINSVIDLSSCDLPWEHRNMNLPAIPFVLVDDN